MDVDIESDLKDLWDRYAEVNSRRVQALEQTALALLHGALDLEGLRESERAAHKLAGSLGTFGLARASALAAEAEAILEKDPQREDARRLSEIILDLRKELQTGPTTRAQPPPAPASAPRLLLIDGDRAEAERLRVAVLQHGLTVMLEPNLEAGRQRLAVETFDAVLLSVPANASLADSLRHFAGAAPPSALKFFAVADSATLAQHVIGGRAGVRGLFDRSTSAHDIAAVIARETSDEQRRPKVLAVDDDFTILDALGTVFGQAGFVVTKLAEPMRFLDALAEASPDLVVLDLDMPAVDGLELCRSARMHPRWESIPIIFVSAQRDPKVIATLFDAGADDYVSKPIEADELLIRAGNRLRRSRLVRGGERSGHSGLSMQRARAGQELAAAIRRIRRSGHGASAIVFGLAGSGDVEIAAGLMMRTLEWELPAAACICRWGPDRFMVVLESSDRQDCALVAERVMSQMQRARLRCAAAVVPIEADALDGHDLTRATESLIEEALASGRSVVRATEVPVSSTQIIDVVIVEDDPMLAGLLAHALHRRGFRTLWFSDGAVALRSLLGVAPVRARVVLLDVDLPGMDGLSLLTKFADAGLTRRTRVMMLTVRAVEGEVLRALQIGAFDHVAKPFSLPILLRKIEIAMET